MKKALRLGIILVLTLIVHTGFGSGTASAIYWCSAPDPSEDCGAEFECCRANCGPGSLWSCSQCKGQYFACLDL